MLLSECTSVRCCLGKGCVWSETSSGAFIITMAPSQRSSDSTLSCLPVINFLCLTADLQAPASIEVVMWKWVEIQTGWEGYSEKLLEVRVQRLCSPGPVSLGEGLCQ